MTYPVLVNHFIEAMQFWNDAVETGAVDMSGAHFVYPTVLLPTIILMRRNPMLNFIPPADQNVRGYIDHMMRSRSPSSRMMSSYIPLIEMPPDSCDCGTIIDDLCNLNERGSKVGGVTAFKYLLGETIGNIYEHSDFEHAFVMAQKYPKLGVTEICICDDGIGIPESFRRSGMIFGNDAEAVKEAAQGLSSKNTEGRGYGLQSTRALCQQGMNSEMLVASMGGLLHSGVVEQPYSIAEGFRYPGTVISMRIKYQPREVNIYDYLPK